MNLLPLLRMSNISFLFISTNWYATGLRFAILLLTVLR